MAQRQAEAGALARRFSGEERVKHSGADLIRNTYAVVSNSDLHTIGIAAREKFESRVESRSTGALPLVCCVEAVRDQIEEHPDELLRINLHRPDLGVEVLLHRDVKIRPFGARAVVCQVEAFLGGRIQVNGTSLARSFAGVQKHIFNDAVGATPMLKNFLDRIISTSSVASP